VYVGRSTTESDATMTLTDAGEQWDNDPGAAAVTVRRELRGDGNHGDSFEA
jgi:hypothetical protein